MKNKLLYLLIAAITIITGCAQQEISSEASPTVAEITPTQEPAPIVEEYLLKIKITSEAIANNQVDESPERTIMVSLPPSYYSSETHYPVVVFLEGYGMYLSLNSMYTKLNEQMVQEGNKEFIIVNIDGANKFRGSFYANSPITGNWEDFVVDEVLNYVDENFRTIPNRDSRGIAGFSMGGSGTINIAFSNSDIFSCMYAASAGVFTPDGLKTALNTWDVTFKKGYGRAFAPVTDNPERQTYSPMYDGTEHDNQVISDWESGYGNMPEKIDFMLNSSYPLTAIRLDVDPDDYFGWLAEGNLYLSQLLDEKGIEHIYVEHDAGHSLPSYFIDNDFVEFFSNNLMFED